MSGKIFFRLAVALVLALVAAALMAWLLADAAQAATKAATLEPGITLHADATSRYTGGSIMLEIESAGPSGPLDLARYRATPIL